MKIKPFPLPAIFIFDFRALSHMNWLLIWVIECITPNTSDGQLCYINQSAQQQACPLKFFALKYHQSKSFKEETPKFSEDLVYKIYKLHGEKGIVERMKPE